MCMHSWDYTIHQIAKEDENKKRSHRYDINRPRSRHGCKYSNKKCLNMMMLICIKQHPSNTWSLVHEKVK